MASLATTTALAGAAATLAYLDAKFHVQKDIKGIWYMQTRPRDVAKAAKAKRASLWYMFESVVDKMPADHECIWSREGSLTWQQTRDRAHRFGQFYLRHGVKPSGSLVAFYMQNSIDFSTAWLGAWTIGSAPAMINFNLAGDALVHCLRVSQAKLVLVEADSALLGRIEEVRAAIEGDLGMQIIVLDAATQAELAALAPTRPPNSYRDKVGPQDPICLYYTSGTTGFPKACAFTVERTWQSVGSALTSQHLTPGPGGDRWYVCMPMYHGTAGMVSQMCLLNGITLCLGRKFSTRHFWDEIRAADATAFVYVGETVRYLLAAPPSPRDREHRVHLIYGNGLRPDVWERFRQRFGITTVVEFFNSTEGVFALVNVNRGGFLSACVGHHGAILRKLLNNTYVPVAVDDDTGAIARDPATGFAIRKSYTEGGEILVACPDTSVFPGYWNAPEATQKRFERDVFAKGDLFYRSGDALRRDDEGRWHFLDRLGDTFRWKSENVSTAEVAVALGRFEGIQEANVYGVSVPNHEGRAGCAAVFIGDADRGKFPWQAFLEHARRELPKYAVPVFIRLVHEQAPMHNNKQNKVPLRAEGIDLDKIRSGKGGNKDSLLWCPPGANTYVPFGEKEYASIVAGKARL